MALQPFVLQMLTLLNWPLISQLVYVTLWGCTLSWVTSVLALYLSWKPSSRHPFLLASLHTLIEFNMSMELIITVVYWQMIHEDVVVKLQDQGDDLSIFINVYIHFLPLVSMASLVVFSNIRFQARHFPFTLVVSTGFILVNFTAVKITGVVYYSFFPFDDVQSWVTALVLVLCASWCYLVTARVVNLMPKAALGADQK